MWLLACAAPDAPVDDSAGEVAPESDSALPGPRLDAEAPRLPYAEVGDAAPAVDLVVTNVGDAPGELSWTVDGDFGVTGEAGPLEAGASRTLVVAWTGAMDTPTLATGTLGLSLGDDALVFPLAAVVGDPAIPPATWSTDAWGSWVTLDLPSAPFAYPGAPYGDASVRIFVPAGWDGTAPIAVATHFHGHSATIDEVDAAQSLHVQHALSGRNAVFVLPQGPVEAADSDFGQLDEPGGYATLVRDVVAVLYRAGYAHTAALGSQVLAAHSGGYSVTANVVEAGGLPVDGVHLFDALYAREDTFADYARAGGRLRSVWTASGGTDDENRALARTLAEEGIAVCEGFTDAELAACAVIVGASEATHEGCVSEERAWARWLAASGLDPTPVAPPVLWAVTVAGEEARVRWRADGGGRTVVVEGSEDGENWETLGSTDGTELRVPARGWLRARAEGGEPSDAYPGDGGGVLVVDGFDRVLGGSWTSPTHPLAARLASGLPGGASGAWHEAVAEGDVRLEDYGLVVWMLGDEGTADRTFDPREADAVEGYLAAGGRLVVSGAEVGYATDPEWLREVLHASFVADDAGTDRVEGWTFGAVYPEDWPDVLDGDEVLWSYGTGGAAAVGGEGRVVVVGFGLENLADADLAPALAELLAYLDG